jgi:hypothetical protein
MNLNQFRLTVIETCSIFDIPFIKGITNRLNFLTHTISTLKLANLYVFSVRCL